MPQRSAPVDDLLDAPALEFPVELADDVELRAAPRRRGAPTVQLRGLPFAAWSEIEVVGHVLSSLAEQPAGSRGGWILTANTDIVHKITVNRDVREMVRRATLVVADGMPVVWAAALQGTPFPERVTGASLIRTLCAAAARDGRSVLLLGGASGTAVMAATNLVQTYPGLRISGWSPPFGLEATPEGLAEITRFVREAGADLVFCGFGFPKQERLISTLIEDNPDAWFVGCGAALAFAAGSVRRAPSWMQRSGLEWLHRLGCEPARLFRRYLVDDLPFALRLLARSAVTGSLARSTQ